MTPRDLFQATCLMSCTVAFCISSYINFTQYFSKKTTTTNSIHHHTRLMLPAITFCNRTGFKRMASLTDPEEYLDNTIAKEDMFAMMGRKYVQSGHELGPEISSIKQVATKYKGRCYTFTYPEEVPAVLGIAFDLKPGTEFKVYFHEPGDEFWLRLDFNVLGFSLTAHSLSRGINAVDLTLSKKVTTSMHNCKDWSYKDFYSTYKNVSRIKCQFSDFSADCIQREYLDHHSVAGFPNCTTPWVYSLMTGEEIVPGTNLGRNCTFEEANREMSLNFPFFSRLANHNNTSCWRLYRYRNAKTFNCSL